MSAKAILVIDDQSHMRRLLEHILQKTGCRVFSTDSGEAAIALVRGSPVDLIVIDFVMPGLDGFETVRRIRENPQYASLPVIMLTGRGQTETRSEAAERSIDVFLTKPFSPIELTGHARRLLRLDSQGEPPPSAHS